ncbi:MAG: DUF4838 domain-containing protein, partial [Fibrobacter sp.]|nr:DUF4838 domain-containing protein [Fibrobacter sp.]
YNNDFKHQEYVIRFQPNALILMGRDKADWESMDYAKYETYPAELDEQATCYAIYDFLERFCGVRWYLPTELGLVFSVKKTLVVKGTEIRRTPIMKYRRLYSLELIPETLCDEPGPLLSARDAALFAHRWRLTGIQPYACNHSFYGYYNRHLKEHPEWFAKGYDKNMPDGTRNKPLKNINDVAPYYPNMCYTNNEFLQHVIKRAKSFFDTGQKEGGEQAAGDFFSLCPMDSTGADKMCKCPECEKLLHKKPPCDSWRKQYFFWDDKHSDYIYGFVNKVARETAKTHPDKYLTMFAYHQTYYPPSREPLETNVAISFCIHALLRAVPAMDRAVNELLDKWDEESLQRPKYLWLYFHRPGPANPYFPAFMPHKMVQQMKDYHKRGFRGIFVEPPYFPQSAAKGNAKWAPIVNQLELYIAFKLADDPTLDGTQMIDEFFRLYYGAAAQPMQALYEKIEQIYCDSVNYSFNPERYFGYQTKDIAWGKLGTTKRVTELGKLMDSAKKAAKTDVEKRRVDIFEKSVWKPMQTANAEYKGSITSLKN